MIDFRVELQALFDAIERMSAYRFDAEAWESALDRARAALASEPQAEEDDESPATGLLPVIVSETGAAGEPEQERIICSAISGGADYANNMPRELFLERVKVGIAGRKSIFARYIQASLEVAQASPLAPLQPVPISERLPGPGDCDEQGRCWFTSYDMAWMLEDRTYGCNSGRSHWLPAHALPLPTTTSESV